MRDLHVAVILARRELVRLVRQPARLAGALGTPAVMWLFLAGGFADAFRPEHLGDLSFAAFLLPGMMTLVAVFGATFASLSLIEDRNEGWLYPAIVSPVARWALGLGRVLGGAAAAWVQAALLLAMTPLLGVELTVTGALLALLALALTAMGTTAIGLAFAWHIETSGGFHAVMNLVFMPLWLLSGSIYPVSGSASWITALTGLNPLTWCTRAVRESVMGEVDPLSFVGAAIFAGLALVIAIVVLARPPRS